MHRVYFGFVSISPEGSGHVRAEQFSASSWDAEVPGPFSQEGIHTQFQRTPNSPPAPHRAQGGTRQVTPTPQGCVPSSSWGRWGRFPNRLMLK